MIITHFKNDSSLSLDLRNLYDKLETEKILKFCQFKLILFFFIFIFNSCAFNSESQILKFLFFTQSDILSIPSYEVLNYNPCVDEIKETGIPIVEINVSDGTDIDSKNEWKKASFSIMGEFCGEDDIIIDEIQIKGRGNSSWDYAKKPYSIKFSSKEKILGMPKSKRWVLIANYSDKTLLRNFFVSKLGNNLYDTVWNPSFKSVNLILNGKYRGVYILGEAIRIDSTRVNIDDISKNSEGGFIFEINARLDEKFNFITNNNVYISLKDPDEVSIEIQNKIKELVQNAENVLFSNNFTDLQNGYQMVFDVNSVIDWYIMNELGKNVDSANFSSIYFYYDPSDKLLHMGPNWDFDLAFGNVYYYGCDFYEGLYVRDNSIWIKRMFSDQTFVQRLQNRWNEKKEELYNYINYELQCYANNLYKAAEINFKKWDVLGHYIWPNCAGYEIRITYQDEVNYMINWLNKRYEYLDKAFNDYGRKTPENSS